MAKTTVKIHGKDYEPVASRLKRFLTDMKNTERAFSLINEVIKCEGGVVVMKCTIKIDDNIITGHAMEEITSKGINSTSALEVAETSALGRCLGHMGYFGSEFPSADEMTTALAGQSIATKSQEPTSPQKALIKQKCNQMGYDYEDRMVGITTKALASELIEELLALDQEQQTSAIEG